jgi:hypothetical protein
MDGGEEDGVAGLGEGAVDAFEAGGGEADAAVFAGEETVVEEDGGHGCHPCSYLFAFLDFLAGFFRWRFVETDGFGGGSFIGSCAIS